MTAVAPSVALLIVTSERKAYLNLLVFSLRIWKPPVSHVLVVDTSMTRRNWRGEKFLRSLGQSFALERRPGVDFHTVLREAWASLADRGHTHVLMMEEDFILLRSTPLADMASLADATHALQVVMPRQRWFEAEYAYPNRTSYLRSKYHFSSTPDGDQFSGYFTSNPHVMRLDRILELLPEVSPSSDYTWENEYCAAAARHELYSLQLASKWPWVWHIGAATAQGVRTALRRGNSSLLIYARAHVKRFLVFFKRRARSYLLRWRNWRRSIRD